MDSAALSRIGLAGLAVMGQNLALNIAEKGFPISVYNRTATKVDETLSRAAAEGDLPVSGHRSPRDFVLSIRRPRSVIILVKAGPPVDQTIAALSPFLDPGDSIIDGGNEWYEHTERRLREASARGLLYLGMGVSGGEDGARHGPPHAGGHLQAYRNVEDVDDGPCVTFMVHNGIEYGDMQLIAEAYDVLRSAGGLSNAELAAVFDDWNRGELESFLVEITSDIFRVPDEHGGGELVDKILDKTGMKGTGKWTVQQAAELSVAAPTIAASLDSRYLSALRTSASPPPTPSTPPACPGLLLPAARPVDKKRLVDDVRQALYASKICSYAQGMNLLRAKSDEKGWNLNLGELARIWKGGCIIRARFLDRIKQAYERNAASEPHRRPGVRPRDGARQAAWRAPASAPRHERQPRLLRHLPPLQLPANLVQAQRDYFGAHTTSASTGPGRSIPSARPACSTEAASKLFDLLTVILSNL
ncbi:6-phosphogluconate dehydrogenase, decarboxylating 2, chloroplastic [Ananas comosus]|uniref:6-phosphogluconate dehydrogenase, decarboxylating n=1 Tax=Ananas comosus TaxID=4615 RepID=A0A199UHJ8_ANACO|nr:6-phosphogluconate dehydrogenase, decarboxylating 2, chloroplastic [Ananas comosus]